MKARLLLSASLGLALAGCEVGPDYSRPAAVEPPVYKEAGPWTQAHPSDAIDRGAWWSVYNDPVLDGLERQVVINNQTLRQSEAAYRQAIALVQQDRAGYFPTVGATGDYRRSHSGGGSRGGASSIGTTTTTGATTGTTTTVGPSGFGGASTSSSYSAGLSASWEIDVWGRISRTVESDLATAQASAADLASATLSAQGTLATDYFLLRARDEQKRLYDAAVEAYTATLRITENEYKAGTASKADVAQARTQLEDARAQSISTGIQRAQYEHAIAVLVGKAPAELTITVAPMPTTVALVPTDLPSTLLQRRPDVAAAERQVAAANASIGVAVSAYYPSVTLNGSYDLASTAFSTLFRASNATWSVGPSLAETIFDAGARDAQVQQARARYDQQVAAYRQTVLTSLQQVEDELVALRLLEQQSAVQARAVQSSQEAERLILNQYKAGTVAFTSVVTAQTAALNDQQAAVTVLSNQLSASVALIQALGGGWADSDVPSSDTVESDFENDHPAVTLPAQTETPDPPKDDTPGWWPF